MSVFAWIVGKGQQEREASDSLNRNQQGSDWEGMLKYLLNTSCMLGGGDRKVKDVMLQCEWHHDGSEHRVPQKHLVGARHLEGS